MVGREDRRAKADLLMPEEYDCERIVFRLGSRGISNGREDGALVKEACSAGMEEDGERMPS
jgi:hypothetical protein